MTMRSWPTSRRKFQRPARAETPIRAPAVLLELRILPNGILGSIFGGGVMGTRSGLEQWPLGAAPVLVSRGAIRTSKLSALEAQPETGLGGESIAGKDDAGRLITPAVRLGLEGKERAKAEKCLADAVYFEARGEPLRGQMAVAQVIMNRVFSGYYPNNCAASFIRTPTAICAASSPSPARARI